MSAYLTDLGPIKKDFFWCNSLLHIVPTNLSIDDIYNDQINLRSNLGLRQCLAFADLLWRFCLIFTPGRVWLMIVTVFSSCHTQIYINITQLPLPGLYIMTFVFQILINETRQPVFSSSMHPHCQTEYHNLAIFPRSAISMGSITMLFYN